MARVRPRDGLYAWLVCMSAFISIILMFGCARGFGLVLPALLDEFHQGKAKTAWVGSLALALSMTFSPLAARLINRFGARPVGVTGGVIGTVGLALSPLATSLYVMYGTFSLMYGMGASFSFTACYDIVSKYFKKRLGLAMGVMTSGIGAAAFVMSPIIEVLVSNFGWRNAFYTFAGFVFLSGVCCLSFSPDVEQDDDTAQQQDSAKEFGQDKPLQKNDIVIMSTPLRKNSSFIICSVYSFLFNVGNTIPLLHLGRYALESGLNYAQTANLYIGYGVATMVGRIVSGKICEYRSLQTSYICCSCAGVVAGVSNIVCPFISGFPALTIYFCVNGLADGFHVCAKHILLIESCETHQRTTAFGYMFFATSLAFASGPPLGGIIADQVGSYVPVFFASGSIVLVSGVLVLTVRCFRHKHHESTRNEVSVLLGEFVMEEITSDVHGESPSGTLSVTRADRQTESHTDRIVN